MGQAIRPIQSGASSLYFDRNSKEQRFLDVFASVPANFEANLKEVGAQNLLDRIKELQVDERALIRLQNRSSSSQKTRGWIPAISIIGFLALFAVALYVASISQSYETVHDTSYVSGKKIVESYRALKFVPVLIVGIGCPLGGIGALVSLLKFKEAQRVSKYKVDFNKPKRNYCKSVRLLSKELTKITLGNAVSVEAALEARFMRESASFVNKLFQEARMTVK